MSAPSREPTTIRLSAEERKLFGEAASRTGETVSNWMRRTLVEAARKTLRKAGRE